MRAAGHRFDVLSPAEEDVVYSSVLRIMSEVGLQVEHSGLLDRLAAIGGQVDRSRQRVTFSPAQIEGLISSQPERPHDRLTPRVGGSASIFYGSYLDPRTDDFLPMTVERAREFFQVARALPHVRGTSILGCPLLGIPPDEEPLYERYWAWSLGAHPGGSIHRLGLCPYILEMCEVHSEATGRQLAEVFSGGVYLVPPLRLAAQEAEQVAWFLERGLRVEVGGCFVTGGATGPVTLAGMATLSIAEGLLLSLLDRAIGDDGAWGFGMSVTALDPRTMMRPYGRPDQAMAILIGAQMARRFRASFSGHCGLTDAKRPSPESAAQKFQSALPALLSTGHSSIAVGLLSIDEVYSPVQAVLDDELISALGQFAREFEVSEEAIAVDLLAALGPGGNFAAEPHTARWFRRELWEPALWSRQTLAAWQAQDGQTDLEKARARALDTLEAPPSPSALSTDEEKRLKAVIARAAN